MVFQEVHEGEQARRKFISFHSDKGRERVSVKKMEPKIDNLTIPGYYANKTILLSGGTGFLGKVIVEKLLRSCPDIGKIILIIRPKRNVTPQKRWDELSNLKLFDRLKREQPNALKKILVIPGDTNEDNFNMSPEHLELIYREVNVIMHGAASINFRDEIIPSLKQNSESTYKMAEMALKITNLESFIYVSTAFTNCDKETIGLKEKIYEEETLNWKHVLASTEKDPEAFVALSEKIVGRHPVRYTFTKMLGELIIRDYSAHYPVVIVRPSIVFPTFEDPFPYWADALNGITAVGMCVAMGILRILLNDPHTILEYVPADWASRVIISSGWDVANRKARRGCEVYCVTFGNRVRMTSVSMHREFLKHSDDVILENQIWHVFFFSTKSVTLYRTASIFFHFIPGLIIDFLLKISGNKPRLMKVYKKIINIMVNKCHFFTMRTFLFDYSNLEKMERSLTPDDVSIFGTTHFDDIDAEKLVFKSGMAAIEFVFKNDMSPEAKERRQRKSKILKYVHHSLCAFITSIILWKFF